jgi:hypothetical protein
MHTYNPHKGEPRDYNNPYFISQSSTLIIITIQVRIHKQVLSEFNSASENK